MRHSLARRHSPTCFAEFCVETNKPSLPSQTVTHPHISVRMHIVCPYIYQAHTHAHILYYPYIVKYPSASYIDGSYISYMRPQILQTCHGRACSFWVLDSLPCMYVRTTKRTGNWMDGRVVVVLTLPARCWLSAICWMAIYPPTSAAVHGTGKSAACTDRRSSGRSR